MRISCNGCRVLRKGCSDDCTLRHSLECLNSPQSQSNATLFLAKFYGRAGLLNLIAAAPTHRRPDIFRSLLYEACGRMINPVHGSVGLMSSGDWPRCHAAVEAVLGGRQISKARVRTRSGNRRKRSAPTSEAKFTITGWDSKDFVIAPRPSHDSSSVETADPSLMRFQFHQGTIPEPPLTLELSLQCGTGTPTCLR